MNALVVDSAQSCLTIAAKKDDDKVTFSLDMGLKQSQNILPGIQRVLKELELSPNELDYMALTSGPGTFTGLRLSYAALKAIELSTSKPLYGIPTLSVYAYPFRDFDGVVLSVIDAKKDQFFAACYKNGKEILPAEDTTAEKIAQFLKNEKSILAVGPDAKLFNQELIKIAPDLNIISFDSQPSPADSLFELAEQKIEKKEPPLKDYDGPEYIRKSEAEIVLEKSNS